MSPLCRDQVAALHWRFAVAVGCYLGTLGLVGTCNQEAIPVEHVGHAVLLVAYDAGMCGDHFSPKR